MAKKSSKVKVAAEAQVSTMEAQTPMADASTTPEAPRPSSNLKKVALGLHYYVGAPTKKGACLYMTGQHYYCYLGLDKVKGARGAGKDRKGNQVIAWVLLPESRVQGWQDVTISDPTEAELEQAALLYQPEELNSSK